jgi:hypothetical protein
LSTRAEMVLVEHHDKKKDDENDDLQVKDKIRRFIILRLAKYTMSRERDVTLAAIGRAEVGSVTERAAVDLRKCEFVDVQVGDHKLVMVVIAGALVLVRPDDAAASSSPWPRTGICVSVCPAHAVKRVVIKKNSCLQLHLGNNNKVGLSRNGVLELVFETEVKALFAKDQIERAGARTREGKLKRIQDMLTGAA